ncbi:MAG: hypothetical protein ACM3OO_10410 [Planctomycetaceae bacterium]
MITTSKRLLLLLLLGTLTAGCAASSARGASSSVASCGPPHVVDERANGTTVQLCVGQTLRIELHSTYWQDVVSSDPSVLAGGSTQAIAPSSPCVPGAGCGTLVTSLRAAAAGTATVSAHRTTCGEALLCRPGQRSYTLTVTVR